MEYISPFEYNHIVTGSRFIGREREVARVKNLIMAHKNIVLYGPPKIGKRSLIYNVMQEIAAEPKHQEIAFCTIDLFNIRSVDKMLRRVALLLLEKLYNSDKEREGAKREFLKGIELNGYSNDTLTERQMKMLQNFPQNLAQSRNIHLVVYFQQFQNILLFDKPLKALSILESMLADCRSISFIIVGDKRNAMEHIFSELHFFRNLVTKITLKPISKKIFCQYICNSFAKGGKRAELKYTADMYDILEGDPWYLQHLAEICFLLTETELDEHIIATGVKFLLNQHDYELHNTVYGLSTHQLMLIKAILDGERRFSTYEVLDRYKLNSSANVNRLKEALTKKELVTFVSKSVIEFNDSLLKLWLKNYFFNDN